MMLCRGILMSRPVSAMDLLLHLQNEIEMERLSLERSEILVVSHAMVLNIVMHIFTWGAGTPSDDPETFKNCRPGNASVSILERSPDSKAFDTLRLWNYQDHLAGLPGDWSLPND